MRSFLLLAMFLVSVLSVTAQERDIPFNGMLTDTNGEHFRKARVYVVSPKRYVTCSKSGAFGLTNIDLNDTLTIDISGKLFKVPIGGRKSLVIRLDTQTGEITAREDMDLFRLGFDHHCKREKGSDTIISGEVLRRSGRTNLLEALKGRVAGLNISSTDGQPGGDEQINIRGVNSLNASCTPLFVVDGSISENFDGVSIYDVDYVKVLREAPIYGVRGANGAILVFTKLP